MDIFDAQGPDRRLQETQEELPAAARPLADRMRPRTLEEFVGQEELLGEGSLLRRLIQSDEVRSMIFWGPPGSGKTTLASVIARMTRAHYLALSAVTSGLADIKRVIGEAQDVRRRSGRRVILFIDEIHRFNRIQQDALLPHVEAGVVVLIGATTENPSFSVIAPLLSRCRVFTLSALSEAQLQGVLEAALLDRERGLGGLDAAVGEGVVGLIARMSDGDARRALNLLEMVVCSAPLDAEGRCRLELEHVKEIAQRKQMLYDASGEEHYNLISAFHKSLRGSDVQAAVYWLVRMLSSGEDPLFILRRMIVFSTEDIGPADPRALQVAVAALQAVQQIGLPEGEIPMTAATVYLATAPKSNASYRALGAAHAEVKRTGSLPVPHVIRNAPTKLMKAMDYGKGYAYDHDFAGHFAPQEYLPEGAGERVFYEPGNFGFEREIAKRMAWWDEKREQAGVRRAGGVAPRTSENEPAAAGKSEASQTSPARRGKRGSGGSNGGGRLMRKRRVHARLEPSAAAPKSRAGKRKRRDAEK